MKKRILCLAMTLFMVVGSAMPAHAQDFVGGDNWAVTFTGKEMNSNFTSAAMTEEILNIQPGDSITVKVSIKNEDKEKTDWYMTNEVLKTLEDSVSVAEGGAYTYILTYKDTEGKETVLYSSETIGGEGENLHQATEALENYFYLDRLESGESGSVQLYVQLEGETQGNDYQDTLARLQMNFAVEKVETKKVIENVKTGDTSQIMLFSGLALVSGLVLLIFAMMSMKKYRNEKGV